MKVKGLDGKDYSLNLAKYVNNNRSNLSSFHVEVRALLKELYPFEKILEEVAIPGSKLFIDFFVAARKLAIEIHGNQHYEFVPFFHKDKTGFNKSRLRDNNKQLWCDINGVSLIVLVGKDTVDDCRSQINGSG